MVHCEGEDKEDEEEGLLCSRLLCHAHLSLSVTGMESGYSRDIHGEVGPHTFLKYNFLCLYIKSLLFPKMDKLWAFV